MQSNEMTADEQIDLLQKTLRTAKAEMDGTNDEASARKWANVIVGLSRQLNDTIRLQQELGKVTQRKTVTDLTP